MEKNCAAFQSSNRRTVLISTSTTGCNKKNGPPLLQNFPLLDYFPCNFCNFDCHCVLQTYTKEFTFISFCQKFLKNAWKNGLRGVQILVRGPFFLLHPVGYLQNFFHHCFNLTYFWKEINLKMWIILKYS